jgi:hypothetical protein
MPVSQENSWSVVRHTTNPLSLSLAILCQFCGTVPLAFADPGADKPATAESRAPLDSSLTTIGCCTEHMPLRGPMPSAWVSFYPFQN